MVEPTISPTAQADLDEAWDYIAARNVQAADRLIDRFVSLAQIHAQFPLAGQSRHEIAPDVRSFVVRPYVAFYRPTTNSIVVLRFLHGRRDAPQAFREARPE